MNGHGLEKELQEARKLLRCTEAFVVAKPERANSEELKATLIKSKFRVHALEDRLSIQVLAERRDFTMRAMGEIMDTIVVSKDGSDCPFRNDDGECRWCDSCMVTVARERTAEELKKYEARPYGFQTCVANTMDQNELRCLEIISGKQKTPEEHEAALKKMRERRRTHTYDYHLADDCPLRKGPITVKMEA